MSGTKKFQCNSHTNTFYVLSSNYELQQIKSKDRITMLTILKGCLFSNKVWSIYNWYLCNFTLSLFSDAILKGICLWLLQFSNKFMTFQYKTGINKAYFVCNWAANIYSDISFHFLIWKAVLHIFLIHLLRKHLFQLGNQIQLYM